MTEQAHVSALAKEHAGVWSGWTSDEGRLAWRYLRPHWRRLVAVIAMAFASSGLELVRMGLVLAFLGAAPLWIVGRLPMMATSGGILLGGIVVASVLAAGWDWWRRHVANLIQRDFTESLRADVCLTMLHRPLDWFTANPAGQASYLLNGQVGRFSSLVPMASDGVAAVLQGLAVVALMAWMSVSLTVVTVGGCGLLWAALLPFNRRIRRLSVEVSVDSGAVAAKAEECAYAIKLIKSCRTEEYERDRYASLARALAEKQVRLSDLRNVTGGLTLIGFVGLLGMTAWMAFGAVMLAGFGILLLRVYPCLTKLIEARTALATMAGHLAAVAEFMEPKKDEPAWAIWERALQATREARRDAWHPAESAISMRDLGCFYTPSKPALDGITLHIAKGQATALVGLTGSGKTTLLDTLAGLRPQQRGHLAMPSMSVAYLTQEPTLLFGSVAENMGYALGPGQRLPLDWGAMDGLSADAPVGSRGLAVSGGQRQLIAISRMAATLSMVRLLDEPTSSLDAERESAIIDWLLDGKRNHITLLATHKLSIASRFDRILVLHGGKIVQDGTHEQLVKEDGLYQRLWRLQEVA